MIFSGLSFKFLGRDKELTSDEFLKFQEDIQFDILKMEFDKLGPDENNMISQKAFGKLSSFWVGFGDLRKYRGILPCRRQITRDMNSV